MYKPSGPFNVPLYLFVPSIITTKGSSKKVYPKEGELIYGTFRTFGGTERTSNDLLMIEDTAVVETWYRPDIKSDCLIEDVNGAKFEVLGTPENIERRNQFIKFKIRAIQGGA